MFKMTDAPHTTCLTEIVARVVQELSGWDCDLRPDARLPGLLCLGYDERAEALLFPALPGFDARAVNRTLQEARCDALVIACGESNASDVNAHVALWSRGEVCWHGPFRLWASQTGQLWLAPDVMIGASQVAVPVGRFRLRPADPPWRSTVEIEDGVGRAAALLHRGMEARR